MSFTRAAQTRLGTRALRSCPRRFRGARGRAGRALRRAATASAPRPAGRRRSRAGSRSLRARAGRPRSLARSPGFLHARPEAPFGQLDVDALARLDSASGANDLVAAPDDGVAAGQRRLRRERAQAPGRLLEPVATALDEQARSAAEPLVGAVQLLALALEGAPRSALEAGAGAVEPPEELVQVGHDEARGHARRRGTRVGREVAERRVLLVADGRHDRHGAGGDRPHQPLVAEGKEILEAAAAPGDDDHVDALFPAERTQCLDHGARCPRPLDVGLADEHGGRRETALDGGEDVALRGGVVAGDEPDLPREPRERALTLRREEPLRGELLLQTLERGQVVAEPERLEREGAQAELASRREELGPAVDVHAVAVRDAAADRVELPAGHGHRQAGAVSRVLEREEDARPARLPPELRDLALDPHRRQPSEPRRDAAVEGAHRVDPAVAVLDRLDLDDEELEQDLGRGLRIAA